MTPLEFYLASIAVFVCVNAIAALGFNLQVGHAGIMNLGILALVATGAYMTGIAALPAHPPTPYTHYIGGFGWAFPWDVLFGISCATVFSLLLGLVALRRLRQDYLALTLVAILQGLQELVKNDTGLFNGTTGLTNIPGPWDQVLDPGSYQVVFALVSFVALGVTYLLLARVTASPLGRAIRAVREDEEAAASLGRDPWRFKMVAFLIGGAAAGLSGALTAIYVTGWSVGAWAPGESLLLLGAVIIGGRGRNIGAVVGAVIVFGLIDQGTSLLPQVGFIANYPQVKAILLGLLVMAFLWFRPEGVLPERRENFDKLTRELSAARAGASNA